MLQHAFTVGCVDVQQLVCACLLITMDRHGFVSTNTLVGRTARMLKQSICCSICQPVTLLSFTLSGRLLTASLCTATTACMQAAAATSTAGLQAVQQQQAAAAAAAGYLSPHGTCQALAT
jgi:hypothetical protein